MDEELKRAIRERLRQRIRERLAERLQTAQGAPRTPDLPPPRPLSPDEAGSLGLEAPRASAPPSALPAELAETPLPPPEEPSPFPRVLRDTDIAARLPEVAALPQEGGIRGLKMMEAVGALVPAALYAGGIRGQYAWDRAKALARGGGEDMPAIDPLLESAPFALPPEMVMGGAKAVMGAARAAQEARALRASTPGFLEAYAEGAAKGVRLEGKTAMTGRATVGPAGVSTGGLPPEVAAGVDLSEVFGRLQKEKVIPGGPLSIRGYRAVVDPTKPGSPTGVMSFATSPEGAYVDAGAEAATTLSADLNLRNPLYVLDDQSVLLASKQAEPEFAGLAKAEGKGFVPRDEAVAAHLKRTGHDGVVYLDPKTGAVREVQVLQDSEAGAAAFAPAAPEAPIVNALLPDQMAQDIVQELRVSVPVRGMGTTVLDSPTALRLAADKYLSDEVAKPFFDEMVDLMPPKVADFLVHQAKSSAEKVSPVLAQMLKDAKTVAENNKILGEAAGRRLQVAREAAGISRGSEAHRDLYHYIGGETKGEWPKSLPMALKPRADEMRDMILSELSVGKDLGVVSPENVREHIHGLLSRYYDSVRESYGFRNSNRSAKLDDLFLRNDAWGGTIAAPKEEVEAGLKALGVDPKDVQYLHQIDDVTAVKVGTDEAAMGVKNALKERFKDKWQSDLRPLTIEERTALKEVMDPEVAVASTYASVSNRNAVARLQKNLAEKFSEPAPLGARGGKFAPEGKVLVPEEPKWGALGGRVMDPKVFEQVRGLSEFTDNWADFFEGFISAAKGDLTGNLGTATVNMTTNAVMSFAEGLSPLDPSGWGAWAGMAEDFLKLHRGEITPRMKAYMDAGGNLAGARSALLGQDLELFQQLTKTPMTGRNWGKLAFQVLSASPNLEVKGLSPWANKALMVANNAVAGGLYGGLIGGPVGAGVGAGIAVGTAPLRYGLAKTGRWLFDIGDPAYQYALFLRNLERSGGDATMAMGRTRKFVQTFRTEDMPEAVLFATGRRPGAGGVERTIGHMMGLTFPGYPVNWVRMAYNVARERPVSGAGMLAAPFLAAQYTQDRALAQGLISPEAHARLRKEQPLTVLIQKADGGLMAVPVGRFFPTPQTALDFTGTGLAVGIGSQMAAKAAFSQAEDSEMPEILGGWQTRKPREEQFPAASLLRIPGELSPYSALGRAVQEGTKAATKEENFYGEPYTWEQAILALTVGLRPKPFHEEDLFYEESKDFQKERGAMRRILRSGATTEFEKKRATEVFEERTAPKPPIPGVK